MLQRLTKQEFIEKVFDFEAHEDWRFAGARPCIVDFCADWQGPCRSVTPILEELSAAYDGKLDVYQVNTEEEPDVAAAFEIQSIPSLLFVPIEGMPQMAVGALPKEAFEHAIVDLLKVSLDPQEERA
jgi:thioredoxin